MKKKKLGTIGQNIITCVLTASIVGWPFFLAVAPLAPEKNEPKKLGSSFLRSTSKSLLLLIVPGASLPVLGLSTAGEGLFTFSRSVTIDVA